MLSRLKLFCPKCPHDNTEYDLYKFQEHHAQLHQGGFHLYACPRCSTRFVTSYLAAHHMLGCWKDSKLEEYACCLDAYGFNEYQNLKEAVDKAVAEALNTELDGRRSGQNTATFGSDSNEGLCNSPFPHSDRQNNNPSYSVESVYPDERFNEKPWGDRGLLVQPKYRPALLGDGPSPYNRPPQHVYPPPSPFPARRTPPPREKRRTPPRRERTRSRSPRSHRDSSRAGGRRSRSRERSERRDRSERGSDRSNRYRGRGEREERRENWRRDPPSRRSPRHLYDRTPTNSSRPDSSPRGVPPPPNFNQTPRYFNDRPPVTPNYVYQGSFQPRLVFPEEVFGQRAPVIPLNTADGRAAPPHPRRETVGRGVSKLVGPMSLQGLNMFNDKKDTDVTLEIQGSRGMVTMYFDSKRLSQASTFFQKLFDAADFKDGEKKLEIHRPLIPFLDVMNLLHSNKVPWKVHCKPQYFTIFHLHRMYRAMKEAKELGIQTVMDFLAKDLFLSRCNLLNDVTDCTACIERIALAKHFDVMHFCPENLKFSEIACVQWMRDCEERSCAPELNVAQDVIKYLRQFIVTMALPGISN